MVATTKRQVGLLSEALGPGADAVHFVDMELLGANPARIIPAWAAFIRAAEGRPARGIGEPLWAGRSDVEIAECQLHESLLNLAVPAETPFWLRCPYDAEHLPPEVIAEAERSHPELTEGAGPATRIQAYAGPGQAHRAFASPLPEPAAVDSSTTFNRASLRRLRTEVAVAALRCGIAADRTADLALAVHELGANSVLHGGGHGTLRLWREPGALVCEVADQGRMQDPLSGRLDVDYARVSGRGLWMVNHLCDLVQLRSSEAGTTVRLHTWR
jgi:anti-sigma regulatory factor (Ser/Thr protein kinase)